MLKSEEQLFFFFFFKSIYNQNYPLESKHINEQLCAGELVTFFSDTYY